MFEEERANSFTEIVLWRHVTVSISRSAMGWYAVCDCVNSWSCPHDIALQVLRPRPLKIP